VKRGTAGLELEVTFRFADDGCAPNLAAITADGVALPEHVSSVLWRYLSSLKVADQLQDAAWSDAERDGDDDAACDDARMPGAAE
jgi:hypothetical protein